MLVWLVNPRVWPASQTDVGDGAGEGELVGTSGKMGKMGKPKDGVSIIPCRSWRLPFGDGEELPLSLPASRCRRVAAGKTLPSPDSARVRSTATMNRAWRPWSQ